MFMNTLKTCSSFRTALFWQINILFLESYFRREVYNLDKLGHLSFLKSHPHIAKTGAAECEFDLVYIYNLCLFFIAVRNFWIYTYYQLVKWKIFSNFVAFSECPNSPPAPPIRKGLHDIWMVPYLNLYRTLTLLMVY